MTLKQLQERLTQWHIDKHGRAEPNMERTALKLCEETGEIAKAIIRKDTKNLEEEVADVFIVLLHLTRGLNKDILELAESKLIVIEQRLKERQKC